MWALCESGCEMLLDGWSQWGLVQDDDGRERPDQTDRYYITAFLTSGLAVHPKACVTFWAVDARMLVTFFEDYAYPFELGRTVAEIAKPYTTPAGSPTVDPLSRGGYIDQFLEGLEAGGFRGSVSREEWISRPKGQTNRLGFGDERPTVDNIIGAIQRAIAQQDCTIQSASVLRALMNASVDDDGELQTGPGRRVGPVICVGRALHALNMIGKRRIGKSKWNDNPIIALRERARARGALSREPVAREEP